MLAAVLMTFGTGVARAQSDDKDLGSQRAEQWKPFVSWQLSNVQVPGNPFDLDAEVVFEHRATGERHATHMFYRGDDTWEFRFTATRPGEWRFSSRSSHDALSDWHGTVIAAAPSQTTASGFLTAVGNRYAQPRGPDGELTARLYNVYLDTTAGSHLHDFPLEPEARRRAIDTLLDRVEANGMDAAFLSVSHGWLEYGALSYRDHDRRDPSLESFDVLESIILGAHERGLAVHIWMWGDEEGRRTPVGIGGINGEVDRRLQRYIAARLGPLPDWTMSYGYDLDEWAEPEQVRSWWKYLHDRMGWPHLLMARETDTRAPRLLFGLGQDKLDVASYDDGPTEDFFETALRRLSSAAEPVMLERRFLHTRDDVWDMDTTRRALWQFTLAGGAGAVWGPLFDEGDPYPDQDQLRTHQRFWATRFVLDLAHSERVRGTDDGYALLDRSGRRGVVYAEDTASIPLHLSRMQEAVPAVAVDTRGSYREVDLGELQATDQVWTAPYRSDWAIAVGAF